MTTHSIALTGLDALDPLAYLAALGCLLATTDHCRRAQVPRPRMSFDLGVRPIPTLHGPYADVDALVGALAEDLDECAGRGVSGAPRDRFLSFSYEDDKGQPVHDLKPPLDDFRCFAHAVLDAARPHQRRTLDWAAATLTDVATDESDKAGKPFALHFTAGQQRFLGVALELLDGADPRAKPGSPKRRVDADDLRAAIVGPWPDDRQLKVLRWSPTQDRAYALRAVDPSGDTKLGTPGADWLALRGIGLLSSAPAGKRIKTSGTHGSWKDGRFSYPLWPTPLDSDAAASLLRHPAVREQSDGNSDRGARRTLPRGVEILTCRISRSDQGGYGAFSRPSRR